QVHLDDDLPLEVLAGVEVEIRVRGTSEAPRTSMCASSVRVDRPAERHPGLLGHLVEGRAAADLVEADVQGLGRVEAADDRLVAVAGEPPRLFGAHTEVVPAHERMFAYAPDGPARRKCERRPVPSGRLSCLPWR